MAITGPSRLWVEAHMRIGLFKLVKGTFSLEIEKEVSFRSFAGERTASSRQVVADRNRSDRRLQT